MTEIPSEMDAPAVHDPGPSTEHGQPAPVDKPRREWRVTKDGLQQHIAHLERRLETANERVVHFAQGLADKRKRCAHWRLAALAGWAAFAVAVVW